MVKLEILNKPFKGASYACNLITKIVLVYGVSAYTLENVMSVVNPYLDSDRHLRDVSL